MALYDTPDGSFLVRDSDIRGEYTLTVRQGGDNKFIHIVHSNGMYRFSDFTVFPPVPVLEEFPSIPALVEHFKQVPLTKFSSSLDVTLVHPISKFSTVSIMITEMCI